MNERNKGFENQCVFGVGPDPEEWALNAGICFARLFSGIFTPDQKKNVFVAWRINEEVISVKAADQYLSDLCLTFPDRWMQAVRIESPSEGVAKRALKLYNGGTVWKQMRFDGTILSASEIYAMLSLFRIPQEMPEIVKEIELIRGEFPKFTWDTCFWLASQIGTHSGHLLISSADGSRFLDKMRDGSEVDNKKILEFSLTKKIKQLIEVGGKESYKNNHYKRNGVQKEFLINRDAGWGSIYVEDAFIWSGKYNISKEPAYLIYKIKLVDEPKKKTTRIKTAKVAI
jgi:hypothetical protein